MRLTRHVDFNDRAPATVPSTCFMTLMHGGGGERPAWEGIVTGVDGRGRGAPTLWFPLQSRGLSATASTADETQC